MKDLKELVRILAKQRIRNAEVFDENYDRNEPTLFNQFYKGLIEDVYENDLDATKNLYGENKITPNFRMLKSRLKRKLYDTIFFLDFKKPEYSQHSIDIYNTDRDLFFARTLLLLGAYNSAYKLLDKVLDISIKREYSLKVISSATLLRSHSLWNKTKYTTEKYSELIKIAIRNIEAGNEAEEFLAVLKKTFIGTAEHKTHLLPSFEKRLVELEKFKTATTTTFFINSYYQILLYLEQMKNNNEEVINICDELIELRQKDKDYDLIRLGGIFNTKLNVAINIKKYDIAYETLATMKSFVYPGTVNWMIVKKNEFILSVQANNYKDAEDVFFEVTSNSKFKIMTPDQTEYWEIFALYLRFMVDIGLFESDKISSEAFIKRYSIFSMLSETPTFSKDKLGFNISIQIIQYIRLLNHENIEALYIRRDSIKQYSQRFLRKLPEYARSYIFTRMLITIINKNFKPHIIEKSVQTFLARLKTDVTLNHSTEGLEVIRYEDLWEHVIKILRNKYKDLSFRQMIGVYIDK